MHSRLWVQWELLAKAIYGMISNKRVLALLARLGAQSSPLNQSRLSCFFGE